MGREEDVTAERNVGSSLGPGAEKRTSEEAGRGTHRDSLYCLYSSPVGLK